MMQDFNFHTHTWRCKHAIGEDEEYVKSAIKNGIKYLGFSDHIPYVGHSNMKGRMDFEDRIEYYQSINKLKEKYKDQIDIKLGFECEYYPYLDDHYKNLLNEVDYLILGQHDYDVHFRSEYFYAFNEEDYDVYKELCIKGLKSGYFKILCHPDYVLLNVKNINEHLRNNFKEIFEVAASLNIPVEVNLNGMKKAKRIMNDKEVYAYPNYDIMKLARDCGCKFVYGIDAHDPKAFDDYKERIHLLMEDFKDLELEFIKDFRI